MVAFWHEPRTVVNNDGAPIEQWNEEVRDNLTNIHDIQTRYLTNSSGAAVAAGDVVVLSIVADNQFLTSTTVGDTRMVGVVSSETIANGALGYVIFNGNHVTVAVTGSVSRDDPLQVSGTVKLAQTGLKGAFARALTASAGGVVVAILNNPTTRTISVPRASSVASAATIAMPVSGNIIPITGTTTITSITAQAVDRVVTLEFASAACQVTNGSNLKLAADYVSTVLGSLTLYSDGTNWIELGRSPTPNTFVFATPAFVLGTANAAGSAGTPVRSDATLLAFDATNPSTQAMGDAAAVGAATVAARRDHKHAITNLVLANLPNIPAVRAKGATQAITTGTTTALTFGNADRWDTDTMHDTATNNTRLTCNTGGLYAISGHVVFAESAVGARTLGIRLNGTTTIAGHQLMPVTTAGFFTACSISTLYQLVPTDYVELIVEQYSGGNLNVLAVANYSPEFAMTWEGND